MSKFDEIESGKSMISIAPDQMIKIKIKLDAIKRFIKYCKKRNSRKDRS